MAEVAPSRGPIRSSFDLGWGGVSHSELQNNITSCNLSDSVRRSMQLDTPLVSTAEQAFCGLKGEQQGLPSADPSCELLQLQRALLQQHQQQQGKQQAAAETHGTPSADEIGIDAQIERLLQLKQFLRRTKQTGTLQQQQQVILEDIASTPLDVDTSGMFASTGLVTPMQSESLLNGTTDLGANSWGNLAAARAAAQPARRSIDMGGLAQQLAALEMSNKAAAAALAESQGLGELPAGMHTSGSFTAGLNNTLGMDCSGLSALSNEDLIAAAAMAAAATAQAEAASRRTSLCMTGPQLPAGLLDNMAVLDSLNQLQQAQRQSMDVAAAAAAAAGAALAMQSSLYAPAAPALDSGLQGAPMTTMCMAMNGMGPAGMAGMPQRSPARHSLDCSLLGAAGLPQAGAMGMTGGLPSPAACGGRASLNLPQAPLLGDRGLAMVQAQGDAAGWGFSARRTGASGRGSADVRRVSSELVRSHTPDQHAPPRKSISALSSTGSSAGSSCGSSGRGSPRSSRPQGAAGVPRRASMDRPHTQPPKWSPSASSLAKPAQQAPEGASAAATATATVSTAAGPAAGRKGTGVFIPSCMIKS